MDEFALIDAIVAEFGEVAQGRWVLTGPGDDASVTAIPPGHEVVSSIDTLVSGVHFPEDAQGKQIGYRAIMVSLSDLAAMGADGQYVLVALTLPEDQHQLALQLAAGMREALQHTGVVLAGGNLAKGQLSITVSVHGSVPAGSAVLRSGAQPGDEVYVSGPLGGAAAALRQGFCDETLNASYWRPRARLDLASQLRGTASAAIDVSDGLLQDLNHIALSSSVCIQIDGAQIPLVAGATLQDALTGGDDYQLAFTAGTPPAFTCHRIGEVVPGSGVRLDGEHVLAKGFTHFA